jgi:hypothetical protein
MTQLRPVISARDQARAKNADHRPWVGRANFLIAAAGAGGSLAIIDERYRRGG